MLNQINKLLNKSRKIIVLTGAGISCNAGIPDFRSSKGLYESVKKEFPEVSIGSGKEMFDISLFRDEVKISVFATFMEKLYANVKLAQPTKTHKFIAHLKDRNKLLRCYTQNIDGLEENLGLEVSMKNETSKDKLNSKFNSTWKNFDVVQLHGDLNTLACTRCFHTFPWNRFWARSLRRGELPTCPECERKDLKRLQLGKRQIDNNIGFLRPNIVLYGENHPSGDLISQGLSLDILRGRPDFFIIMGTSLKVDGVKKVVRQMSKQVHERGGIVILINKTSVGDSSWNGVIDYQIWSDCDTWVTYLEDMIPDFFKTQKQIEKLRQLKRENSELKKKKLSSTIHTPPTTPTKIHELTSSNEIKIEEHKNELMSPEQSSDDEKKSPKKRSRKVIPKEGKIVKVKRNLKQKLNSSPKLLKAEAI